MSNTHVKPTNQPANQPASIDTQMMLASQSASESINAKAPQYASTYCRLSGVELQRTPVIFSNERSIHFSKHWIFNQKLAGVLGYHYAQADKTHSQRSLLALAMITQPHLLGQNITIKFPAIFNELKLKRNYGQLVLVVKFLDNLSKERRQVFLRQLPKLTSNSFAMLDFGQSPDYQSVKLGDAVLNYVLETVTGAMYSNLSMKHSLDELTTESQMLKLELEFQASIKASNAQAGILKSNDAPKSTPISDYWQYIFEELAVTFELSGESFESLKRQLRYPTNLAKLNELASYLNGLYESTKIRQHETIPSIQFRNALLEVRTLAEAITNAQNNLDLRTLATREAIEVIATSSSSTTTLLPEPVSQLSTEASTSQAAKVFAGSRLGNIMSKLAKSTATATAKRNQQATKVETTAIDFIVSITPATEAPATLAGIDELDLGDNS